MARLWVNKGNTIKKNRNLVVCSAVNAYIRLNTKPSALSDINAS